ncbi:MAG: hypothetical protein ACREO9_02855, partial [Lysobacterales bacterium]
MTGFMPLFNTHRFLLAIEADATRYHGTHASQPELLDRNACDTLLAHLAADLANLLPESSTCRLITAGALFDQTQLLRPGYPVFEALERLLQPGQVSSCSGHVSLAAINGVIPLQALQPESDIPLGLLQLMPLLVTGRADTVRELAKTMEHRFLEQGQVSAQTAQWLESAFRIKTSHARFMTVMDLNAMFRLQLEHFGFLALWQLLDAALNELGDPLEVAAASGQVFIWRDGAVHTTYQTFNYWSQTGDGRNVDSQGGMLAGAYADWTRDLRQFLTVLQAHAVPLRFYLPERPEHALEGTFFIEQNDQHVPANSAEVTEHSFAELGTLCVSAVTERRLANYYPLSAQGLNDIHSALREEGLVGA